MNKKNLFRFFRKNYLLATILLLAFLLRVIGVNFGYPYALNFDEMQDIPNSLKMLQGVHLKPPHYIHGSFYFYFYEFFALIFFLGGKILGTFKTAWDINPVDFIIFSRLISAIVGTITVYLTYLVGKRLFLNNIGIVAAALLATNFLHVMVSHYATQDALLGLGVMISFYFAVKVFQTDRMFDYAAFGASCGVATAISMTGVLLMGLTVFIVYQHGMHRAIKKLLLAGLAALLTFLLLSPYFILDFAKYYADVMYTVDFYNSGKNAEFASDLNGVPTWLWWAKYFTSTGLLWPLSLAVLIGLVYLIKKGSMDSFLLLAYPILCSIVLLGHSVRYDRNATSLLPFFALIAAIAISKLIEKIELWRLKKWATHSLIFFLGGVLFAYPMIISSLFAYEISKKDTSFHAAKWIETNVKKNEQIAIVTSCGVESFSMPFNRLVGPYKVLFTHIHVNDFVSDPDIYLNEGFRYIIIGSDSADQSVNYRSVYGNLKYEFFNKIKDQFKLVAKYSEPLFQEEFFSPHSLERSASVNFNHHRTYEIYSLKDPINIVPKGKKSYYTKNIDITFPPSRFSKYSNGQLMENPESKFGETILGDGDAENFGVWGPYEKVPVGNYEVTFSLKISHCNDKLPVAEISVQSGGIPRPYSKKTIKCVDFRGPHSFKKFKLTFHNPVQNSWSPQIETPVKSLKNGTIEIEYIEVKGKGLKF